MVAAASDARLDPRVPTDIALMTEKIDTHILYVTHLRGREPLFAAA